MRSASHSYSKIKLGLALWLLGLPGIIAVAWLVLPQALRAQELPTPLPLIQLMTALQLAAYLALCVWIGTALSARIGLHAPVLEAMSRGDSPTTSLRTPLTWGLAGAAFGAGLLIAATFGAPLQLASAQEDAAVPLVVRVLYGGITEELLMRWGIMTLVAWCGWRFFQRDRASLHAMTAITAVAASAALFAIAHLPTASLLAGGLSAELIRHVLVWNSAFGIVAGILYWRAGLESAIIAHVGSHMTAFVVVG